MSNCGITDLAVLSLDHVNGGGDQERLKFNNKSGILFYTILKKSGYPDRDKYQVLCMNCQFKKERRSKILSGNRYSIKSRKYRLYVKNETLSAYGGCKCVRCDTTDLDILTLDHINGNGSKERKILGADGSGAKFYQYLKKNGYPDRDKYQVLCINCQFKKEFGEFNEQI